MSTLYPHAEMSREEFEAILRRARVMRAEAFAAIVRGLGRALLRPFRQPQAGGGVASAAR